MENEALKTLAEIFRRANPPVVPPRVPVREVGQKKPKEVNHEGTETKRAPQSKSITIIEPLRLPTVDIYPDER